MVLTKACKFTFSLSSNNFVDSFVLRDNVVTSMRDVG